jgi:hypothetical protein
MPATLWKTLLSFKRPPGIRVRLMVLRMALWESFAGWWLLLLSLILLAIGLGLILRFDLIGLESARWTLSALVQAGAALIGIFFVALGLLWTQANREEEKLKGFMPKYMERISPSKTPVLDSLQGVLRESARATTIEASENKKKSLRDCFLGLVILRHASSLYYSEDAEIEDSLTYATDLGLTVTEQQKGILNAKADLLRLDATKFFTYLFQFDNELSLLRRDLKPVQHTMQPFANVMTEARKVDQLGVSLYKLRFFGYFSRKGLIAVSSMWLLCLVIGLLMLVALDRIPDSMLPYFVSVPIGIGVMAIGTTLSLGLRAMRSTD